MSSDEVRRALLAITALCHAAGALAYAAVQPRGFPVLSAAFFEHQLLGPLVLALALALGFAVVKRRDTLAAVVTAVFGGFWFVVAGFGSFTGSTEYARLLLLPFAGSFLLFALAHRLRRRSIVLGALGALLGAGFWASALAPPASTVPSNNPPKSGPIPEAEPNLQKGALRVFVEGNSVHIEAGLRRAEIVPSFDYDAVADGCGFTVLDYRSSRLPPYRAGRDGEKLVFAAENDDFQAFGEVTIEGASTVRIEVSTTVRRELCAHLGSIVAVRLSRVRAEPYRTMLPPPDPPDASINGIPWPRGVWVSPAPFVAFRGGELGFFDASYEEKGPFTWIGAIDEPVITAAEMRVRVPSWKTQASRAPSPTAGWGISQGAIERAGEWYFWGIASTSIGRGWHTVRTAAGTYETTILVEAL